MNKKNCIRLIVLIIALFLTGCASIPQQLVLVNNESGLATSKTPGDCAPEKLYQSDIGPVSSWHIMDASNITLLNWNIYKEQRDNWSADFLKHSAGQNIIVLQEALLNQQLHNLLSDKKLHWNLNTAFYLNDIETGVMTASTVKPIYKCGLRTTEPLIRTPKTTLISRFQLSDTDEHLLVANIHGINFSMGTEVYAQQIKAMTNILSKHTGPLIIAGDFNNWSDDRVDVVDNMVKELGLNAVSYKNHNRITLFGNVIDHVFYRQLELMTQDTIKVTSSDHNPIKVTFKTVENNLARSR